jgi:hypothetical protein
METDVTMKMAAMKTPNSNGLVIARWIGVVLILCGILLPSRASASGLWYPVNSSAPGSVWLMLLLSDGTVLAANNPTSLDGLGWGNDWFRLTPDTTGSYLNGNWTKLNPSIDTRGFFSTEVLQDGRVFVAGGEYGTGTATAQIFDPTANGGAGSWTYINPPTSLLDPSKGNGFVDSESEMLPNGNVLVRPTNPATGNGTLIYNPKNNTWSAGPPTVRTLGEEGWVKLTDGSILTIDPIITPGNGVSFNGFGTNSERYIPSQNQWVPDANLPAPMYATLPGFFGETGPGFLLPNGKAFFLGGAGHTAIYTPSGTNTPGSWVAGPNIPQGLVSADAPAAMMRNGKILCAVASPPYVDGNGKAQFPAPTSFFEYDYANGPIGSFAQVNGPTDVTDSPSTYQTIMLDLPDGGVLYAHVQQANLFYGSFGNQLYIYYPDGPSIPAGKPTITSVTQNGDGSYHLVGTKLNGISEGASYGDDAQMNSNYPLVCVFDPGVVTYGRTYNWSSTGVRTGNAPVSTEFTLPDTVGAGTYFLAVIANGISSDTITFDGPAWVDFHYSGAQNGSYQMPFETLANGVASVSSGGTISFKAGVQPSLSHEIMTISKAMTIVSFGGPTTIGQ